MKNDWYVNCSFCGGYGFLEEGGENTGCGECDCRGYFLTDEGERLVHFIKKIGLKVK